MDATWRFHLEEELQKSYLAELKSFLKSEASRGVFIYPPSDKIFNAFKQTSFDQVKVVILGQDPYHGPGQAHGLSFSVPEGVPLPPSLRNIFKEVYSNFKVEMPRSGDLTSWARQGVLLLNSVLTVEHKKAASHGNRGWERFTDAVIQTLSHKKENLVFLLWGGYALSKGKKIDRSKHLVLSAPHPSPLSAHRGFLGCQHFIKANEYLEKNKLTPINWAGV